MTRKVSDHWLALIDQKKFHPEVATKTLNLSAEYTDSLKHRTLEALADDLGNHPSIGSIEHYRGMPMLVSLITVILEPFIQTIKVGKGFTPGSEKRMLGFLTELLVMKYPRITLADLRFAMMDHMGDSLYDRFDVNVILSWIPDHLEKRLSLSSQRSHIAHEKRKKEPQESMEMPPEIRAKLDDLEKGLRKKKLEASKSRPQQYHSLYHYCHVHDVDPVELNEKLNDEALQEWKEVGEDYIALGMSSCQYQESYKRWWLVKQSK